MVKERANGLYGPTSFLIANIIIGIPFLCPPNPNYSNFSHNLATLLSSDILAHQPSFWPQRILQLPRNPLPRPPRRGIPRSSNLLRIPHLRRLPRSNSLLKRPLDGSRRLPRHSHNPQRLLEIYLLPIRLPALCLFSFGKESDGRECVYLRQWVCVFYCY